MSENMPDFDNMSQEEIMAWMETLAKRQGASEGFTTAADMDIAEVDPNTAVIDEPGYIPYGQEQAQPPAAPSRPSQTGSVTPPPQFRSPVPPPPARPQTPVSAPPVSALPQRPPVSPAPPASAAPSAPVGEGALAWLESLAADQGDELFNLDLSDLPAETHTPTPAASPTVDPMTWLEDLARSQVAEPSLERLGKQDDEEESEKLDPFAEGVNPMEWLETLAKRQGAKPEELTTPARMNIPAPEEAEVEQNDYQPFSFDTPPARRTPEPAALENPADWLTSLAGSEGYSEEGVRATQGTPDEEVAPEDLSMGAIQDAIASGTVTREQMQYFLDQQADQLAEAPEDIFEPEAEDAPLAAAELPDWLSELKPEETTPTPTQSLDTLFEAPAEANIPDWLRQDTLGDDVTDLDSIFVSEEEEASAPVEVVIQDHGELESEEIESGDTWAEAFDLEYEQGIGDIDAVPEWYEQNVSDPARIAAVEGQPEYQETSALLEDAALPPEKDLAAAQVQAVPDWMEGSEQAQPLVSEAEGASAAAFEEMPDWLKEVESSVAPDEVPEWLIETMAMEETPPIAQVVEPQPVFIEPPKVITPPPAPKPVSAPTPPPAPQPRILAGEAAVVLERARDREQSGDLEGALSEYEAMIRSSTELETVVADLTQLVRSYKTTPAVYRVLGDGLMRQGKLQAALNTYREALNQL